MRNSALVSNLAILLLLVGCGPTSDVLAVTMVAETDVASTLAAVTDVPRTETLAPIDTIATDSAITAEETKAAEQAAEDEAATAEAASEMETQTAIEAATAAAQAAQTATQEAADAAATQEAEDQLAAIDEVLQKVGYSTSSGSLAWVQDDEISIFLSGGGMARFRHIGGDKSYRDFVIHYNVTWDTGGIAGCSLIFRSEEDLRNGQQYQFNTLRFSGLPGWDVELHEFSRFQSNVTGQIK
ncbi:MAG: hypothetical protein IH859_05670, partial [Chloroflexi bacterium]|nr:hypothetical protein [Chloroflexota bacterium]